MDRSSVIAGKLGATLLSAFFIATPLQADQGQFYLAPGFQWMDFDASVPIDEDTGWFLGVGYSLTDRWNLELSSFDLGGNSGQGEFDIDSFKLDLLYDLDLDLGAFQPFVVAGLGESNFNGDHDMLFDLGAGLKLELTDRVELRSAARTFNYLDRDRGDMDFGIDTSLVIYLGGSRPSRPAPAQAARPAPSAPAAPAASAPDSDRDGVPDSRDACPDTPMNYAVDARGCPIPVEEVARVELMVNFAFDRAEVQSQYFDEIEEVADFMKQYPDVIVELEGHTDSQGTEEYNEGLSQRRADAVRQVMIDRFDIQGSRITARGFGESQPIASNDNAAGRAQNRRVITVIIKTLQNYQPR